MSDETDNITKLPIKFKSPPSDEGPMLKIVDRYSGGCNHSYQFVNGKKVNAKYMIREGETEVECSLCETKLDPMFVLRKLAVEETQWHEAGKRYHEEMKRLSGRRSTKCEHCRKMTRISCH